MRKILAQSTPRLRRYAHALLGRWPVAPDERTGRPRPNQDADDLAHQALLGVWRDGCETMEAAAGARLWLALCRRVTDLGRAHLAGADECEGVGRRHAERQTHFAWAPESRALPLMPFDLRALLALVILERLNYQQAGEVLDMPGETALARLAVARARFASLLSGEDRPHLLAVATKADKPPCHSVTEGDLHRHVDDLLDPCRRAEICLFLEARSDAARRTEEWRRHAERLRQAFEPLLREPLPLSLDFSAQASQLQFRQYVEKRRSLFAGLAPWRAPAAGGPDSAPRIS
jgi:DNA-directed RNA polymerase specialized sigma24 family protein